MKIQVYYRSNLRESYNLAVIHVPNDVVNVKSWCKNHLKSLGIKASYLILI